MTCGRTQGFLAKRKVEQKDVTDARKKRLSWADAKKLVAEVDEVIVARRGSVQSFDVKGGMKDEPALEQAMLGPTGNLRAPTFRVGRKLVVGFDEATYRALF
ncbi:MAG TPA: ArsC family (seleno)protein [Vicinamibacteria bacterium]|nr:ArsC family (seleno)protein [Vicinamibacteria bacterium]